MFQVMDPSGIMKKTAYGMQEEPRVCVCVSIFMDASDILHVFFTFNCNKY